MYTGSEMEGVVTTSLISLFLSSSMGCARFLVVDQLMPRALAMAPLLHRTQL